jgi:uridylate kinase
MTIRVIKDGKMSDTVVMSLGGALIVPNAIDTDVLHKLSTVIESLVLKEGKRLALVCGGGATARNYIAALREMGVPMAFQDQIGRYSTVLNAHLVASILREHSGCIICRTLEEIRNHLHLYKVAVSGFISPGSSTDYDAVLTADFLEVSVVYNLTDVAGVFDHDPKEDPDAILVSEIRYQEYISGWIDRQRLPGSHSPFDVHAAELAKARDVEVRILSLHNTTALFNALQGLKFVGTRLY